MKIIVDKMPRYYYVDVDCIFAELTGEQIGGKDYSYLEECKCKISGDACYFQKYDECPFLKELKGEEK